MSLHFLPGYGVAKSKKSGSCSESLKYSSSITGSLAIGSSGKVLTRGTMWGLLVTEKKRFILM